MIFKDAVAQPFTSMLNGSFGTICAIAGGAAVIIYGIALSSRRVKKYTG
jgi:hypothetical protein